MTDFLSAVNPWHLMFDLLGWAILLIVLVTLLGSFFGAVGGIVKVLLRQWRGK